MNNIPENEQWLLDADCDKCRRNNYCRKPCKRFRKVEMEIMRDIWNTAYENAQKRVDKMKEGEEGIEE